MTLDERMYVDEPIRDAWRTCLICGHQGMLTDVRPGLAWLETPGPGGPLTVMPRCKDHLTCRVRCEANGDPWPLVDR